MLREIRAAHTHICRRRRVHARYCCSGRSGEIWSDDQWRVNIRIHPLMAMESRGAGRTLSVHRGRGNHVTRCASTRPISSMICPPMIRPSIPIAVTRTGAAAHAQADAARVVVSQESRRRCRRCRERACDMQLFVEERLGRDLTLLCVLMRCGVRPAPDAPFGERFFCFCLALEDRWLVTLDVSKTGLTEKTVWHYQTSGGNCRVASVREEELVDCPVRSSHGLFDFGVSRGIDRERIEHHLHQWMSNSVRDSPRIQTHAGRLVVHPVW